MRRNHLTVALIGALALTAACEKQPTDLVAATPIATREQSAEAQGARRLPPRAPLARIVAMRAELGLSDDQVARLKAIQSDLQTKNKPLVDQIRTALGADEAIGKALRALTPEQRRAKREELAPVLRTLRANTRAAMKEARGVLTADQQAKLREARRAGAQRTRERRVPPGRAG